MKGLLELCKPRIVLWVMVSAGFGYVMAGGSLGLRFWALMGGVGLTASACGALNQWMESDVDALMDRTKNRPIPSGRMAPRLAGWWGVGMGLPGCAILWWHLHVMAVWLAVLTMVIYLLCYTPLKKVTPHCSWVGAVAGAMPPLLGWAAWNGRLGTLAWILFGVQFLWQIPHFLALFWMYREEYAKAGFRVTPVMDPTGGTTAFQMAIHSFGIVPLSLLPFICGLAGVQFGLAALSLGTVYLVIGLRASWTLAVVDTRRLFLASLVYLPLLFTMLAMGVA